MKPRRAAHHTLMQPLEGDPSSGGASAGFTRARNASSMTASLLFHQRYRVAVLTPACLANSCADTDAIPRFFSRR